MNLKWLIIYSLPSHQELYQNLTKCFNNYIPINIIPNTINEENLGSVIEEVVNHKAFEKTEIEIETYEWIEELKNLLEYTWDSPNVLTLDELNENETNDPWVQAMFKRSRRNETSFFIISLEYYELLKRPHRNKWNIYQIFKPNNTKDVPNLYQDKVSIDMALNDIKLYLLPIGNKKINLSQLIRKNKNKQDDIVQE